MSATRLNSWLEAPLDVLDLFVTVVIRVFTRRWRIAEILQAVVSMGIGSIPIIVLATTFAGILVSTEIAWHMDQALNSIEMIPGITGQFVLRELGIAVPALLMAAKAGAATTAEVGSMKVTEQIDALRLLGIDPIDYLVVPRFIGSIISMLCLTLIAVSATLLGALGITVMRYSFAPMEYLLALRQFVEAGDIFAAVIKGACFGAVIPIVSCSYGFRCRGGAEGVGSATTNSVVASTVGIILLDFLLTWLLL